MQVRFLLSSPTRRLFVFSFHSLILCLHRCRPLQEWFPYQGNITIARFVFSLVSFLSSRQSLTRFLLFLARSTHSYAFELTDLFTHERIMRLFPGHKMHLFGHSPDGVSLNLLLLHSSRLVQFADADLSTLSVLFFPGQVSSHLPPSTRVLSFGS